MTLDESIKRYTDNAEYERTHGNLQGSMEFKQLEEWLKELKAYKESMTKETKWETCFDCPLSHGCPKIRGCTNEQAIDYTSQIPNDCPLSVQPQPKTGHWITTRTFMHDGEYYCDKCKCDAPNNEKWDYCPNCGAKMVEPQESEETDERG